MKKLMYIAAALLVLVGCNKKENVIENAPQNLVTITGGIDFSAQDGPNKVVAKDGWEDVASGNKVGFVWEVGDKIAVVDNEMTEIKQFTIKSISEDKQSATFTGEPLSIGMESYAVLYPYEYGEVLFNKESKKSFFANQQYSGKLRPYIMGFSKEDGTFTMEWFWDVMDLSLTGSDKLGKIVYHIDKDDENQPYDVTLSFGNGGLQLTEQPQHVTFIPCALDKNGFKLSFYDTNNQLIMEKKSEKNIVNVGGIISFPTLEVKAAAPTVDPKDVFNVGAKMKFTFHNDLGDYSMTYIYNGSKFEVIEIIQRGNDVTDEFAETFPVKVTDTYSFHFEFSEPTIYIDVDADAKTYVNKVTGYANLTGLFVNDVNILDQLTEVTN